MIRDLNLTEKRDKFLTTRLALAFLIIFILLFLLNSLTPLCSAQLTNETGQTHIKWTWAFKNATIYLDGLLIAENTQTGHLIISDLNPYEEHVIQVIDLDNSTTYVDFSRTKPKMLEGNTVLIFIVALVLFIVGIFKYPLVLFMACALFFYGGYINVHNSLEGWIIISYYLMGIFSLFGVALGWMSQR
jgi:hypothetical protein